MGSRRASISVLALGGITGHKDFARDTGVIVPPDEAIEVADKILRVFIEHGDRTNRAKARLKYVLDAWGFEKFLGAVEEKLGRKLSRAPSAAIAPRPRQDRLAHIGVHPQKQPGLNWIGVALAASGGSRRSRRAALRGSRESSAMAACRLTVWQNLLLTGVPDARVAERCRRHRGARPCDAGLAASRRACRLHGKFRLSFRRRRHQTTRRRNRELIAKRPRRSTRPINIHLTGCHHSCAQHYIGDIGLIGARVPVGDEGDTVEGYHILVGGGFAEDARHRARTLFRT